MSSTAASATASPLRRRYPAVIRRLGLWALHRWPALRRLLPSRFARPANYAQWVKRFGTLSAADRAAIRARIAALPPRLISVVMPVYNTDAAALAAAIASVQAQLYPHWELCIADDASTAPHIAPLLAGLSEDRRIRTVRRPVNGHISAATNTALSLARGEFVALMDHDDLMAEHALYWVAEEIAAHPDADLIYTDEDWIDAKGRRLGPNFKPDWDPDLVLGLNLVTHLAIYRRSLLTEIGGLREGFEGSQDHDLVLRAADHSAPPRIRHIQAVLYHWRVVEGRRNFSQSDPEGCAGASRRAISEHLQRRGITGGRVEPCPRLPLYSRVIWPLPENPPLVSVIVLTRDRPGLLAKCAEGVLQQTDYQKLELLIVDNGSVEAETQVLLERLSRDARVGVQRDDAPFNFAALNNRAAAAARGEILLLLNNDIEVMEPGWLREMVSHAVRPDVGVVGARLLYPPPQDRVQHGGVVLGIGGQRFPRVAGHYEPYARRADSGYLGRLQLVREVAAVTGACLAVRATVFAEVGGLDAGNLPVAFNDIDLCLRIRQAGYRIVWTPFAELYHRESATRGSDDRPEHTQRFMAESNYMRDRWGPLLDNDPFYNPNFSLEVATYQPGPPRRMPPWLAHPPGPPGN